MVRIWPWERFGCPIGKEQILQKYEKPRIMDTKGRLDAPITIDNGLNP